VRAWHDPASDTRWAGVSPKEFIGYLTLEMKRAERDRIRDFF